MHGKQSLVSRPGRFNQLRIRPIGHVYKTDVIVLAVHATQYRFVAPCEPVCAQKPFERRCLFQEVAISNATLMLILRLHQSRCETVSRNTDVVDVYKRQV